MASVIRYDADASPPNWMTQALAAPIQLPMSLWHHRHLISMLTRREIGGRFRGSLLGTLWVVAQPLALYTIYYLIFGIVFAPRLAPAQGTHASFAAYLFSGIIAWNFLAGAPARIATMVPDNAGLLKNVTFPGELLAVPIVLVEAITWVVGATVLVLVGTFAGAIEPTPAILALPIIGGILMLFALGLGLLLATIQVFVRDTAHAYSLFALFWMFLSPVFWEPAVLLQMGSAAQLLAYNPAYVLLQAERVVVGIRLDPHPGALLTAAFGCALLMLTLGYGVFTAYRYKFPDQI